MGIAVTAAICQTLCYELKIQSQKVKAQGFYGLGPVEGGAPRWQARGRSDNWQRELTAKSPSTFRVLGSTSKTGVKETRLRETSVCIHAAWLINLSYPILGRDISVGKNMDYVSRLAPIQIPGLPLSVIITSHLIFYLFITDFLFLGPFWVHSKIQQKVQRVPHVQLPPPPGTAFPTINILHQSRTSVRVDEPTLTHHYHPKSIVYFQVHCRCCTFYGFWQVCNDMYPQL